MAIGTVLAVLVAVFYQGYPLKEVIAGLNYGYTEPTGVELVDKLLLRGGIQSMMYTFSLSCIAIAFGGVMEHVGYLPCIIEVVIHKAVSYTHLDVYKRQGDKVDLSIYEGKVLTRYTPNTITSLDELKEELVKVKRRGYAMDHEEQELGLTCIGAPILDQNMKACLLYTSNAQGAFKYL